jgi:transcriptional regulator with XRE-family HTH domain
MLVILNHRRLRQWRLDAGLSLEEAAARAGISYPYLRSLEDGYRANPSARKLVQVCAVYGDHDISELYAAGTGDAA